MRCLTLAQQVRQRGATVEFICANYTDHMGSLVRQQGFELHMLKVFKSTGGEHLFNWSIDAAATSDLAKGQPWDWLVADHYGIQCQCSDVWLVSAAKIDKNASDVPNVARQPCSGFSEFAPQ